MHDGRTMNRTDSGWGGPAHSANLLARGAALLHRSLAGWGLLAWWVLAALGIAIFF